MFIFCGSVLYSIVVQSTVLNKKKLFNMFIYHEAYLTYGMLGKQVLVVTSICKWVTQALTHSGVDTVVIRGPKLAWAKVTVH